MNLVALEMFADAVGPREQIHNVGVGLDMGQLDRLVAGDFPSIENPLAQLGNTFPSRYFSC